MESLLRKDYPEHYERILTGADILWMVGTNLRRIIPDHLDRLRSILDRGGIVNAIFVKPGSEAAKYSIKQEYGIDLTVSFIEKHVKYIEDNIGYLTDVRTSYKDRVNIYTIDFPLTYGMDVINNANRMQHIYLRLYPFDEQDKPIIYLTTGHPYWFDFYGKQLTKLIKASVLV